MPYCGEGKQTSLKDKKLSASHTHFMMHSSLFIDDCQNWDKCLASPVRQGKVSLHKLGGKSENSLKRNLVLRDCAEGVRRCCRSFSTSALQAQGGFSVLPKAPVNHR